MRARVACRLCDPESEVCKKLFTNLDNADSIVSEIEFLSMHLFLIIICTIAEARLPLTGYFETRTFAMQLYNKCDQMVSTLKGKLTLVYGPRICPATSLDARGFGSSLTPSPCTRA